MNGQTSVGHTKADETDVYAGRGPNGRHMLNTPVGKRGWLGNPFTLENHSRSESIERFEEALVDKIQRDDEFATAIADLSGKTLGCWCQRLDEDEPACHAEVIAGHADTMEK